MALVIVHIFFSLFDQPCFFSSIVLLHGTKETSDECMCCIMHITIVIWFIGGVSHVTVLSQCNQGLHTFSLFFFQVIDPLPTIRILLVCRIVLGCDSDVFNRVSFVLKIYILVVIAC